MFSSFGLSKKAQPVVNRRLITVDFIEARNLYDIDKVFTTIFYYVLSISTYVLSKYCILPNNLMNYVFNHSLERQNLY